MTLPEKQKYLIAVEGYPTADPGIAVTPYTDGSFRWALTHIATGRAVPGLSFPGPEEAIDAVAQAYAKIQVPWSYFDDDGLAVGDHSGMVKEWRALIHKIAEEMEEGT